jgi:hypothetical protein
VARPGGGPENLKRGNNTPAPEHRRCQATSRQTGERCGHWTADERITVCRYHGGHWFDKRLGRWTNGGGRLVTGRYSQAVANIPELEELYQRVLADEEMHQTEEEIALLRAMLARWMEKGKHGVVTGEAILAIARVVETIDKMVTRRHQRIHGANLSITVRDWEALFARVLDISHEFYGDQSNYADYVRALANMNQPKHALIQGTAVEVTDGVEDETGDGVDVQE